MAVIAWGHREALVICASNMYEVVRLHLELGEIVAAERYVMGLVCQIAPADHEQAILLHVVGEEGLVESMLRAVCKGCSVHYGEIPPEVRVVLGSGEPSEDGEDFAFENGGSE